MIGADLAGKIADLVILLGVIGVLETSLYYVYRQSTTAFGAAKSLLVAVHLLSIFLMATEVVYLFVDTPAYTAFYAAAGPVLIMWGGLLLSLMALAIYAHPVGSPRLGILGDVFHNRARYFSFAAVTTYTAIVSLYFMFVPSYSVAVEPDALFGNALETVNYSDVANLLLFAFLAYFLLYPTALMLRASRRKENEHVRREFKILPLSWFGIGLDFIVFSGFWGTIYATNTVGITYLIMGGLLAVTANTFRKAVTLSNIFAPPEAVKGYTPSFPFSKQTGIEHRSLYGNAMLLEIDPASKYEEIVRDFTMEFASNAVPFFVFSAEGSAARRVRESVRGGKYYTLTSAVDAPKATPEEDTTLVPDNSPFILVDLVRKVLSAGTGAVVYDNLSGTILVSGLENAYSFAKAVNELVAAKKGVGMFIILSSTPKEQIDQFRPLFPIQILYAREGLKVVKKI